MALTTPKLGSQKNHTTLLFICLLSLVYLNFVYHRSVQPQVPFQVKTETKAIASSNLGEPDASCRTNLVSHLSLSTFFYLDLSLCIQFGSLSTLHKAYGPMTCPLVMSQTPGKLLFMLDGFFLMQCWVIILRVAQTYVPYPWDTIPPQWGAMSHIECLLMHSVEHFPGIYIERVVFNIITNITGQQTMVNYQRQQILAN
jgi:hypothetical protein